jgi:hypothetical protein
VYRSVKLFGLFALTALSSAAGAQQWQLHPAEGVHGIALTFSTGGEPSYRFECAANEVIVTETGVTKLMDVKTNKAVGDDAAAAMSPGAAMMAVYSGKGDPQFVPAEAVKNPAGGWDLTIRLPKDDKQLMAIGKSDMMSLFTTGETMAVTMDGAARDQWNDFMRRCKTGS